MNNRNITSSPQSEELGMNNGEITKRFLSLLESISGEELSNALKKAKLSEDKMNSLIKFVVKSIFREIIQEIPSKTKEDKWNDYGNRHGLDAVDMEIVYLAVQGKTTKEISEELQLLHLSEEAVHKRFGKIYKKTKTGDRKRLIRDVTASCLS